MWGRESHWLDCGASEILSERGVTPPPLDIIHGLSPLESKGWGQRGKQIHIVKAAGSSAKEQQVPNKFTQGCLKGSMSQKRNNKQPHWASHAASATKEQAQEPISWEEPPLVEHLDTQEEHTLVGPSSLQHQLGEKEVNMCRFRDLALLNLSSPRFKMNSVVSSASPPPPFFLWCPLTH